MNNSKAAQQTHEHYVRKEEKYEKGEGEKPPLKSAAIGKILKEIPSREPAFQEKILNSVLREASILTACGRDFRTGPEFQRYQLLVQQTIRENQDNINELDEETKGLSQEEKLKAAHKKFASVYLDATTSEEVKKFRENLPETTHKYTGEKLRIPYPKGIAQTNPYLGDPVNYPHVSIPVPSSSSDPKKCVTKPLFKSKNGATKSTSSPDPKSSSSSSSFESPKGTEPENQSSPSTQKKGKEPESGKKKKEFSGLKKGFLL